MARAQAIDEWPGHRPPLAPVHVLDPVVPAPRLARRRCRTEEFGHDVGDVAAVIVAGARPLLDLDAAARAEPVHDVVRIVPLPLVGQADPDDRVPMGAPARWPA